MREFHLKDLPKEPEEMAAWLHKLWQEKDLIKEKALKEDWEGLEDLGFEPFKEVGIGRVMALQRYKQANILVRFLLQKLVLHGFQAFPCKILEPLLRSCLQSGHHPPPCPSYCSGTSHCPAL